MSEQIARPCGRRGCGNRTNHASGRCDKHRSSVRSTSRAFGLPPAVPPLPDPTGGYDEVERSEGLAVYYRDGELHREDGPAIEKTVTDYYAYYRFGVLHRTDGPAVIHDGVGREWIVDGEHHRLDGPAIIEGNASGRYFIAGVEIPSRIYSEVAEAVVAGAPLEWAVAYAEGRE